MSGYRTKITLDKLFCRDTESIHSSDNILLMGEVHHDGKRTPFVVPGFRLNDYETHVFPAGDDSIFDDVVEANEVTLVLGVWDVDSNEAWTENKETIQAICNGIAIALKFTTVVGGLFAAFANTAIEVIDKFVEWDKDDELLAHERVLKLGGLQEASYETIDVPFARHQEPDYSGFDYTLTYQVMSQWQIDFGNKEPAGVTYQPDKGSVPSTWIGDWVGDDITITITATPGEGQRINKGLLDVEVTEKVGTRTSTTTTIGVSFDKKLLTPASVFGRKNRRNPGEMKLEPSGLEAIKGESKGEGSLSSKLELGPAIEAQQYGGDHVLLNNEASLEMCRMVNPATPDTTPALRYRRPVGEAFHVLQDGGREVMLHRRTNL